MNLVYGVLACIVVAHAVVAFTATIVVLRDSTLQPFQVWGKIACSWIVVYVGPLFILYVMNEHSPHLVPNYAKKGLIHRILFAPVKPSSHSYGSNKIDDGAPVGGWSIHHSSSNNKSDSDD